MHPASRPRRTTLWKAACRAIARLARRAAAVPPTGREAYAVAFPCLTDRDPIPPIFGDVNPVLYRATVGCPEAKEVVYAADPETAAREVGGDTFVVTDLDERIGELRRTHGVEVVKKYSPKDGVH